MTQDVFSERLARLDGVHTTRAQAQSDRAKAAQGRAPQWVKNLGYPSSVVGACLLGILSVMLSRYCMFHINGVPDHGADPDMTMIVDGMLAVGIAFVFRMAFHLTDKIHLTAKVVGIWIALTTMHNLVHDFPEIWSLAFSPEWVAATQDMTEPRTIYVRGMSFELSGMLSADTGTSSGTSKPEIKINRF